MSITGNNVLIAFKQNHDGYLRKVHLALNKKYYTIIFSDDDNLVLSEAEISELRYIENVWIEHEMSDCLNRYNCYKKVKDSSEIECVLQGHPVFNHKIFTYLSQDATLDDLKNFILNDSVLNLEFFDYLVLSVIGVSDQAKLEIMNNLWDEAGRGSIQGFHTTQFKKLMLGLGLKYRREMIIENMPWEGLAGINLFSYLSLYSSNKMKYFGLLAATEMLDPPHYHRLIRGMSRFQQHIKFDTTYYTEHEKIDVEHANGWLNKVILPELLKRPHKTPEFWLGFYLRLDSAQRYYDKLLELFMAKQAA